MDWQLPNRHGREYIPAELNMQLAILANHPTNNFLDQPFLNQYNPPQKPNSIRMPPVANGVYPIVHATPSAPDEHHTTVKRQTYLLARLINAHFNIHEQQNTLSLPPEPSRMKRQKGTQNILPPHRLKHVPQKAC